MDDRVSVIICDVPIGRKVYALGLLAASIRLVVPLQEVASIKMQAWPGWKATLARVRWGVVVRQTPVAWLPVRAVSEPRDVSAHQVRAVPTLLHAWARIHQVIAFFNEEDHIIPLIRV